MKKRAYMALAALSGLCAATMHGHTPAESNEVVSAALTRAAFYYDDLREGTPPDNDPPPTTWLGFLGPETNGWTLAGKMAAFDRYLSTLATNDCKSLDYFEQLYVAVAVGKCEEFNYTNSASAMKALALNPRGVERNSAIRLAIGFSPVDNSMTEFVETIMTNYANYSFRERGAASDKYAWKLLGFNATNAVEREAKDSGVRMFYRNRMLENGETPLVDELFVSHYAGYGTSSNRLVHAINSFSYPKCARIFGDYFSSVTNQLLSSGQPLPWISIGTEGN